MKSFGLRCTVQRLHASLRAQDTVSAQSPRTYIENEVILSKSSKVLPRYTYFKLSHAQNRTRKGKLFLVTKTLYEYTWIGDLPYGRVVKSQGKPLNGKELVAEQTRYEKAIADHQGLDARERAKEKNYQLIDVGLPRDPLLSPATD